MQGPAERIRLIEASLRCLVFGLLSLIPLLGLAPAILAFHLHLKTWAESGGHWNPARRHLLAGYCLAWLGSFISIGFIALVVLVLIKQYGF